MFGEKKSSPDSLVDSKRQRLKSLGPSRGEPGERDHTSARHQPCISAMKRIEEEAGPVLISLSGCKSGCSLAASSLTYTAHLSWRVPGRVTQDGGPVEGKNSCTGEGPVFSLLICKSSIVVVRSLA